MTKKVALRKTGLALASLFGVLAIGVGVVSGQNSPPGVGYGAIATDSQQNIAVGRSTTISQTKFGVQASSTASSSYALRVEQPGGSPIFWVRNDGAVSVPGSFTAGTFTGTMSAANVSAGQFGANTGGGNFMFPAAVDFDNRTHSDTLRIVQVDSGNWAIQAKKDWESFGSTILFPSGSPGATPYLTLGYNSIVTAPGQVQFNANGGSVELLVAENLTMVQSNPLVVGHWATTGGRLQVRANVGEQVRLEYTDNVHAQFTVDSVGRTTINTAGSAPQFNFTGGNVGVGTSTPAYPLSVNGTIFSSTGGFRFPDGTTQTTAATGTATLAAPNVSSGAFGANTGGGNYTFPASVRIGTSTAPTQRLQVDGNLALTSFDSNSGNLLFTDYNYSPPTTGAPGLTRTSSNGIAFIGDYASVSIQENKPLTLGWGNEILGNGSYQLNFRSGLFDTSPAFVFKNKANGAKLVSFTNSSDSERAYISTAGSMYLNEDGGGVYVGGGYASFRKQIGGSAIVESSGALNLEGTNIDIQAPVRISADHGAYIEYSGSGNTAMRLQHFGGFDGGVIMQNAAGRYIFRGAASQSANLTEWQNSSNTRLFSVSATGTIMFPDGSVQTTAFTGGASTISASNVSAGQFGANTGGGNYFFPASLGVSATPQALFHAGPTISDTNGLTFSNTGALIASTGVDQTASRTNVLSLMRDGTSAVIFAGLASFDMSRWSTSGVEPRAQLDIRLSHANTTNLVEVLSLQSSGKVGIGVTTPDATLDIGGGIANSIAFYPGNTSGAGNNAVLSRIIGRSNYGSVSNSQSAAEIKFLTGSDAWYKGQIAFFTNDSDSTANLAVERMRLSNAGYLGIATTSPQYPLSVNGVIFSSSGGFRFPDGTTQTTAAGATISAANVSSGSFGANTGGGNYTFPANLIVSNASGGELLQVTASGANRSRAYINTGSGIAGVQLVSNSNSWYIDNRGSNDGSLPANRLAVFNNGGGELLSFLQNGQIVIGNPAMSANPNFKTGDKLVIGNNGSATSSLAFASNVGTVRYRIYHPNALRIEYDGSPSTVEGLQLSYVNPVGGLTVTPVQIPLWGGGGTHTYFNAGGNFGIGTTNPGYPLEVAGVIYSNTGGFRFPDGTTQTTAATGASTMAAANVSSGSFGANTGGGNYTFPADLIVTSNLTLNAQTATRALAVDGSKNVVSSFGSASLMNSLTDETGSGVAVFGTSPVFTTNARISANAGMTWNSTGEAQKALDVGAYGVNPVDGIRLYAHDSSTGYAGWVGSIVTGNENSGTWAGKSLRIRVPDTGGTPIDTLVLRNGNVSIGNTNSTYKLEVSGVIYSNTGGFRFPDGTTQTTAATGGSTIAAANVSSGAFGANTGGGNYTFPGTLGASGVITSSGSNTNIGAHPSYGTGYAAFWRTGGDYSLLADASVTYLNAPTGAGSIRFRTGNAERASLTASQFDVYVPTYIYNMDYGLTVQNSGANHSRMRLSTGTGIAGFELISNGATWYIHHRGNNEAPANRLGFYNNAGAEVLTMASGGNVGIGNNNPGYKLDVVSGGATTARIGTGSGDTLTIGGGAGKINVGTVDPIYQIGNDKFATYMAGMIGVKEEVTGELAISCVNGRCEKVIDFGEEPRGSDLWLFGQVTDIDRHLPQASIILTPSFDGRVSYRKGDGEITIIATTFSQEDEVRVSYRFTAPRFDADKWGNTTDDPATSFTIEEK